MTTQPMTARLAQDVAAYARDVAKHLDVLATQRSKVIAWCDCPAPHAEDIADSRAAVVATLEAMAEVWPSTWPTTLPTYPATYARTPAAHARVVAAAAGDRDADRRDAERLREWAKRLDEHAASLPSQPRVLQVPLTRWRQTARGAAP